MGVYCVKQGKIKIYKNGTDGREQVVRLAAPGDLVGYRAFLGEEHYTCTAATLEDSVVCFVDRNSFQKVLGGNHKFTHGLLNMLTQELRDAENMIRDMAQKSVRERLASGRSASLSCRNFSTPVSIKTASIASTKTMESDKNFLLR